MMNGFLSELKTLRSLVKQLIEVRTDLAKLSIADKITTIVGWGILLFLGVVSLWFVVLLLAFCLAEFLATIMPSGFAYLISAGSFIVFWLILFLLRKPLIFNPISRAITRALFKPRSENDPGQEEEC